MLCVNSYCSIQFHQYYILRISKAYESLTAMLLSTLNGEGAIKEKSWLLRGPPGRTAIVGARAALRERAANGRDYALKLLRENRALGLHRLH